MKLIKRAVPTFCILVSMVKNQFDENINLFHLKDLSSISKFMTFISMVCCSDCVVSLVGMKKISIQMCKKKMKINMEITWSSSADAVKRAQIHKWQSIHRKNTTTNSTGSLSAVTIWEKEKSSVSNNIEANGKYVWVYDWIGVALDLFRLLFIFRLLYPFRVRCGTTPNGKMALTFSNDSIPFLPLSRCIFGTQCVFYIFVCITLLPLNVCVCVCNVLILNINW